MLFGAFPDISFASNNIEKIESTRSLGVDYINIELSRDAKPKAVLLENQLIIDFPDTSSANNLKITRWKSTRIKDIKIEQAENNLRLVVDLAKASDYELVNIFGRNKTIIELYDHVDYTAKLMQAWEKRMLDAKTAALSPYEYKSLGSGALLNKVIVLDPGHGGADPGAISPKGYLEKHLTLTTAQKTALILSRLGATVYLTRNSDRTNNLRDIVNFANKVNADIFICLHYNFISRKDISGTETFYYNPHSRKLGLAVHQSLIANLGTRDRGLRRQMFYTVHHTKMPAVLIEPLFLSNEQDENKAASPEFEQKIAYAISEGVINYFRNKLY